MKRCYSIVQFSGREVGELRRKIGELEVGEARKHFEEALNEKIRSISLACGKLLYENQFLKMVYLRLETDNNNEYFFEIYDESAYTSSNTDAITFYSKIINVVKHFLGEVELPKTRLIGFS